MDLNALGDCCGNLRLLVSSRTRCEQARLGKLAKQHTPLHAGLDGLSGLSRTNTTIPPNLRLYRSLPVKLETTLTGHMVATGVAVDNDVATRADASVL
mmetsp:Transcript_29379/g.59152  ORF Transcript_29379/g.59152 Transcript_29379/m.59152 type:complete len:98 (-) Transcript_29379:960-1253(-)